MSGRWTVGLAAYLAIVFALPASGEEQPGIFLHGGRDSAFPDVARNWSYQGLLGRELMRQALLCAAREEPALPTYDLHLGQPAPAGAIHFDVVAVRGLDRPDAPPSEIQLLRGEPPRQELLVAAPFKPKSPIDIVELVRLFEARSRGSFLKYLQDAGVPGQPQLWNKTSVPSEETLRALAEMNFVSQFRAACSLHEQIARERRSAEVVAALVRAYANLGVLTEWHWAPAHDVFTARSLIYAQRLVAAKHDNTLAYTSRAYAYALAGLHQAALDDLNTLEQLAAENKAKPGELAKILRSYCAFHIDELDPDRCETRHTELVRVLRLLAREQGGSTRKTMDEALAVTKAMPHCYRAHATLGLRAGVSLGHVVTLQTLVDTERTLYPRLTKFSNLPEDLKAAIPKAQLAARPRGAEADLQKEMPLRAKMISAYQMNEAFVGEQRTLSWPVLGHLMAEHSLLEVYMRARFEKRTLAVPPDQFLDLAAPLYQWHRMASVLDALRGDIQQSNLAVQQAAQLDLDTVELSAIELNQARPADMTPSRARRRLDQTHSMAILHLDATASDLVRQYPYWQASRAPAEAELAFKLSPHAPLVRNHMVAHHWTKIEPQLDQWLRDAEADASQMAAIGIHFRDDKQPDKAIEFFRKARDLSPEFSYIRLLADAYKAKGEIDQWRATLEEIFKLTDYSLEHAKIKVEIADFYINRHDYPTALPLALEAAATYSEWGLLKAAQCFEALQQWQRAEAMYRAASERYDEVEWMFFTRRTGQGDAAAAEKHARQVLNGQRGSRFTIATRYFILLGMGNAPAARVALDEAYKKQPDAVLGLHLAMALDAEKDTKKRDAILAEITAAAEKAKAPKHGVVALAEAIVADLAAGGQAAFDVAEIVKLKSGAPNAQFAPFDYLLGKYLAQHGKSRVAEKLWLDRMSKNTMTDWHRTLCGVELRARGIGPTEYKDALQKIVAE